MSIHHIYNHIDTLSVTLPWDGNPHKVPNVQYVTYEPLSGGISGYSVREQNPQYGFERRYSPERPQQRVQFYFTGESIRTLKDDDKWIEVIGSLVTRGARATRIDLAIDYLNRTDCTVDSLLTELLAIPASERTYRKPPKIYSGVGHDGQLHAQTIYLGSTKSDKMLRIYDKGIEQYEKGRIPEPVNWIRAELQARRDYAATLWGFLTNTATGKPARQRISGFMRAVVPLSLWNDAEPTILNIPVRNKDTYKWLVTQVAPAVAKAVVTEIEEEAIDNPADIQSFLHAVWVQPFVKALQTELDNRL